MVRQFSNKYNYNDNTIIPSRFQSHVVRFKQHRKLTIIHSKDAGELKNPNSIILKFVQTFYECFPSAICFRAEINRRKELGALKQSRVSPIRFSASRRQVSLSQWLSELFVSLYKNADFRLFSLQEQRGSTRYFLMIVQYLSQTLSQLLPV